MSTLFNRLFGPSTKTHTMSSSDAITQNRHTVNMLEKKIKYTSDKNITPFRQQALTLVKKGTAKAKGEARRILGRTKIYEKQVVGLKAINFFLLFISIFLDIKHWNKKNKSINYVNVNRVCSLVNELSANYLKTQVIL